MTRKYTIRFIPRVGRWGLFLRKDHPRHLRSYKTLPGAIQAARSLYWGAWRARR